jgi:hypothetical protein
MKKFNLQEHLAFLEDVEKRPEYYDFGGVSYWSGKHCPKCSSTHGWAKVLGGRYDMGWNECLDCGWKGDEDDLLTEGEFQNIKRTELIDKIISEK